MPASDSLPPGIFDHLRRYAALFTDKRPAPSETLDRRDPEFIRAELDVLARFTDAWFAPEVDGIEHVPEGPSLVVGTHNGGNLAPDMFSLMVAFWRHFGPEHAAYGLAHDTVFHVPVAGRWLERIGAVPARQEHAIALLERGATVLVYPGGELDAFKPHGERHTVKFGERTGFVRTALRARVPIVPVVSVGAHDTFFIVTDGRVLAERLHLKQLARMTVMPLILCLPWILWVGPYEAHLPLPSKLRIRVLPPMHFDLPPEAADDKATVKRVREEVRARMQSALDDLVAEGHFGPGERLADIVQPTRRFTKAT